MTYEPGATSAMRNAPSASVAERRMAWPDGILQHHRGVRDPGRLRIENAPVKLRDLQLC